MIITLLMIISDYSFLNTNDVEVLFLNGYLSIGQTAKLKNVSIKSLRYYDEIGILKPAFVNAKTGYRYYKEEQLPIIDAISLCIELGIPLREFTRYKATDGSVNLEHLLFDGKNLAEQKIKAMSEKLTSLQHVLRMLDEARQLLDSRVILCIPFDEFTTPEHYNPKLLELLVTAQRLGMQSAYPSGLLYEYPPSKGGRWASPLKYVFIHILEHKPGLTFDANNLTATLPNTNAVLKKLPAGSYICTKNQAHRIQEGTTVLKDFLTPSLGCQLLEMDIINTANKGTKRFELQVKIS